MRRVQQALSALSEQDREVLLMRHVEELPYSTVARILDIDPAAARKRYGRALLRLRALLAEAESLGDVVTIEAELTRRQADLEALLAQAALLEDQVALASVSVTLTEPSPATGGFGEGLQAGWSAFLDSARTLATGLGAALPFLAAIAVILLPVAVVVRGRRQDGKPAAEAPERVSVGS